MLTREEIESLTDDNLQIEKASLTEHGIHVDFSFDIGLDTYLIFIEFVEIKNEVSFGSLVEYRDKIDIPKEIDDLIQNIIEKIKNMIEDKPAYRLRFVTGDLCFEKGW